MLRCHLRAIVTSLPTTALAASRRWYIDYKPVEALVGGTLFESQVLHYFSTRGILCANNLGRCKNLKTDDVSRLCEVITAIHACSPNCLSAKQFIDLVLKEQQKHEALDLNNPNFEKYSGHQLRSWVKPDAVFEGNRHDVAEVVKQFGVRADLFRPYLTTPEASKPLSFTIHEGTSLNLPISDSITHCALEITKAPPFWPSKIRQVEKNRIRLEDEGFTNIVSAICFNESAEAYAQSVGELECFFAELRRINGTHPLLKLPLLTVFTPFRNIYTMMDKMSDELTGQIEGVRGELKGVKSELTGQIEGVRGEMEKMRTELTEKIDKIMEAINKQNAK